MAYWLSNVSTLLLLLQRTLKAGGAAGMAPQRRRSSATLFGRMTQVNIMFLVEQINTLEKPFTLQIILLVSEFPWNPPRS